MKFFKKSPHTSVEGNQQVLSVSEPYDRTTREFVKMNYLEHSIIK